MRIVIVGNGIAGMEAALAVREREPDWDVTIVSEESDHLFARTALMYVASGQLSHRCIEPHARDLYRSKRFTRVRARALGVDVAAHRVRLAGGLAPLSYDRLLIACGSTPRPAPWPGAELARVGTFVTLQDLEWLEHELHGGPSRAGRPPNADAHLVASEERSPYRPRPVARTLRGAPRHPAVIGGGLIGLEVVEVLLAAGLSPRFYVREDAFWPSTLDPRESAWIAERLRAHGVDVRLGEDVEALEGEHALRAIRTDRGEAPCDLCVVAIGVMPNTEWLRGSDLALDALGGIVVDAGLRAGDGVFAAGDCASVPQRDGTRRPEPLWYTARAQGRIAGRALSGDDARYERGLPYDASKLIDIEHTSAGTLDRGARMFFFEERGKVRSTTRIAIRDGRVIGFHMLGRRWDHTVFVRWVEEGRTLPYVLDRLNEARFDTELVPPLVIPHSARAETA